MLNSVWCPSLSGSNWVLRNVMDIVSILCVRKKRRERERKRPKNRLIKIGNRYERFSFSSLLDWPSRSSFDFLIRFARYFRRQIRRRRKTTTTANCLIELSYLKERHPLHNFPPVQRHRHPVLVYHRTIPIRRIPVQSDTQIVRGEFPLKRFNLCRSKNVVANAWKTTLDVRSDRSERIATSSVCLGSCCRFLRREISTSKRVLDLESKITIQFHHWRRRWSSLFAYIDQLWTR